VFGARSSFSPGVEVFLAYEHLSFKSHADFVDGDFAGEGSVIVAYFMHLRFEKKSLVLSLDPLWSLLFQRWCVFPG